MLDAVVAAALEHGEKPREVAGGVRVGRRDRVAHAGLGREMNYAGKPLAGEQLRHRGLVGEVDAGETKPGVTVQPLEPGPLQGGIVVVVQVIESDDLIAARQQALADVVADEAGGAGYQVFHAG